MDRSRRCWISSFRFFATSRSDAPVEINLVLFATPCRFYLASLVILIVLSLHTFPTRFRLYLPFRFRFLRPALLSLSSFLVRVLCSFPSRFPFPSFFPVSRLPVPSSVLSRLPPACPVPLSRLPSRLPPPSRFPLSRFPVRFPVLFPLSFRCYVCVRPFACAFVRSFVRSFVLLSVRSFVHSFVRVRVRSFVRSLGSFPAFPVLPPVLSRPPPISRLPLFY